MILSCPTYVKKDTVQVKYYIKKKGQQGTHINVVDSVKAADINLFPYFNNENLYDGLYLHFVNPPLNKDSSEQFLCRNWYGNTNVNMAFGTDSDMTRLWQTPECVYYTYGTIQTEAMNDFPLKDLYHWWPSQYNKRLAQQPVEKNNISSRQITGKEPVTGTTELNNTFQAKYSLKQNFPNLFNPTNLIEHSISKTSFVSFEECNILRQDVVILFKGYQKPGNYKVNFNETNLSGGVYSYKLGSGDVSITKKFVLIK